VTPWYCRVIRMRISGVFYRANGGYESVRLIRERVRCNLSRGYRELRLLAGQELRNQADKKAGAPVLENVQLDAVLAAADAGCFATYITKQGGVLVPRKHHIVRTAYELNDEPTPYGDHGTRIYGIWSPLVAGRICTHATKWKMVRKAVDVQEATADQGASAPWTRGNNCPPDEKLNSSGGNPVLLNL